MATEAELFQRFAHRIRAYGLRHLGSLAAADDLVQEVLVVVLEALREGKVREPDKLASFVLGTCRLVSSSSRATERRRERLLERFGPRDEAFELAPPIDLERLHRCLDSLADRQRTIVALTFYGERDGAAIASELGMTIGNVRVARHRALLQLHACMGGDA